MDPIFPESRAQDSVIRKIILVNILVYLLWGFASESFMEANFLVSWTSLMDGRVWVLLTAVFSHNMFWHILLNMFVLSNFGQPLERIMTPRKFLAFYLTAGIFSSFIHALVSLLVIGEPGLPALGASGAISGLVIIFSLLFPKAKILIFGLIPINAIWGAVVFVGLDLWGLIEQAGGAGLPIGHGAHLGGAFAGFVYYLFVLRRQINRPRAERYVPKSDRRAY